MGDPRRCSFVRLVRLRDLHRVTMIHREKLGWTMRKSTLYERYEDIHIEILIVGKRKEL